TARGSLRKFLRSGPRSPGDGCSLSFVMERSPRGTNHPPSCHRARTYQEQARGATRWRKRRWIVNWSFVPRVEGSPRPGEAARGKSVVESWKSSPGCGTTDESGSLLGPLSWAFSGERYDDTTSGCGGVAGAAGRPGVGRGRAGIAGRGRKG